MIWASIDPSKAGTGVALWNDTDLTEHFVIKPRGKSGAYYTKGYVIVTGLPDALLLALDGCERIFIERGAGGMLNAVRAQGFVCGYIAAVCACNKLHDPEEVVVSEWRRVIKEDTGISWPASRDRKKALAIDLVHQLYGRTVDTDDEADAILLGHACKRLFNIK